MPVLMNKGADPRQAAWLFYTDHATLDGLGALSAKGRYDAGVLTVDAADLDAAPKASSEVPVYLAIATLVPEDFDLDSLVRQANEQGETAQGEQGETAGAEAGDAPADSVEAAGDSEDAEDALPYQPVPAPEGTRILAGMTTAAAARAYVQPREVDGKPWAAELPGLPMLVSLIDYMREHGGLPRYAVWHVDQQGILRMSPAKQVRPMAGNILSCKL